MTPLRKIVQVAVSVIGGEDEWMYALCADGSLWLVMKPTSYTKAAEWKQIAGPPGAEVMVSP